MLTSMSCGMGALGYWKNTFFVFNTAFVRDFTPERNTRRNRKTLNGDHQHINTYYSWAIQTYIHTIAEHHHIHTYTHTFQRSWFGKCEGHEVRGQLVVGLGLGLLLHEVRLHTYTQHTIIRHHGHIYKHRCMCAGLPGFLCTTWAWGSRSGWCWCTRRPGTWCRARPADTCRCAGSARTPSATSLRTTHTYIHIWWPSYIACLLYHEPLLYYIYTSNYRIHMVIHTYIKFLSHTYIPGRDGWWARPAATCPGSTTWRGTRPAAHTYITHRIISKSVCINKFDSSLCMNVYFTNVCMYTGNTLACTFRNYNLFLSTTFDNWGRIPGY